MKLVLICVLSATALAALCDALCFPEHPQTSFCNADYVIRVRVVSKVQKELWPPKPRKIKPTESEVVTDGPNEVESGVDEAVTTVTPPGPKSTALLESSVPDRQTPDVQINSKFTVPTLPPRTKDPNLAGRKIRNARGLVASVGLGFGGLYQSYGIHKVRYQHVVIKRVMKGKKLLKTLDGIVRNPKKHLVSARIYVSGIELKPGRPYLLMGKVIKNRLWLSRCNLHTEWNNLTIDQRGALKKYYQQNCDCRVQFCYYTDCQKIKIPGGCMWRPRTFPPSTDCGVKHRYCKKRNGECLWEDGKNYDMCVRDLWPF